MFTRPLAYLSYVGLQFYSVLNPLGEAGPIMSTLNWLGLEWLRDLPLVFYAPRDPALPPRGPWGLDPEGLDLTGLREVGLSDAALRDLGQLVCRNVDPATIESLLVSTVRVPAARIAPAKAGSLDNRGTLTSLRGSLRGNADPLALLDLRATLEGYDSPAVTRTLVGLDGLGDSAWLPPVAWHPEEELLEGLDLAEQAAWWVAPSLSGYFVLTMGLVGLWAAARGWAGWHVDLNPIIRIIGPLWEWEDDGVPHPPRPIFLRLLAIPQTFRLVLMPALVGWWGPGCLDETHLEAAFGPFTAVAFLIPVAAGVGVSFSYLWKWLCLYPAGWDQFTYYEMEGIRKSAQCWVLDERSHFWYFESERDRRGFLPGLFPCFGEHPLQVALALGLAACAACGVDWIFARVVAGAALVAVLVYANLYPKEVAAVWAAGRTGQGWLGERAIREAVCEQVRKRAKKSEFLGHLRPLVASLADLYRRTLVAMSRPQTGPRGGARTVVARWRSIVRARHSALPTALAGARAAAAALRPIVSWAADRLAEAVGVALGWLLLGALVARTPAHRPVAFPLPLLWACLFPGLGPTVRLAAKRAYGWFQVLQPALWCLGGMLARVLRPIHPTRLWNSVAQTRPVHVGSELEVFGRGRASFHTRHFLALSFGARLLLMAVAIGFWV